MYRYNFAVFDILKNREEEGEYDGFKGKNPLC
jgi:hypothetical protein